MTNKPKAIGTAAETAVRNALLRAGYSELNAHRNVLKGSADEGDVWLRHPTLGLITFEVKGGKAAKGASDGQIDKWWQETLVEKKNANAYYGFLVTQKAGIGLGRAEGWPVYVGWGAFLNLAAPAAHRSRDLDDLRMRFTLGELLDLIA